MKWLVFLVATASLNLYAEQSCSDLSGTYRCKDLTGRYVTVTVEQEGNEFYLEGVDPLDRVIADGQRHHVANSSQYRNASYTAQCSTNGVSARGRGELYQNGWPMGNANFDLRLDRTSDQGLEISLNGTINGPLGGLPLRERRKCESVKGNLYE